MVPNFSYANSMLLLVTKITRTQKFYFFWKMFLRPISLEITYQVNKESP